MPLIKSRLWIFFHTRVGIIYCLLSLMSSTAMVAASSHKISNTGTGTLTEMIGGANSVALFLFGIGITLFHASEYSRGSLPYQLLRFPNRVFILRANSLFALALGSIIFLLINAIGLIVGLTYIAITGSLSDLSIPAGKILLGYLGLAICYCLVPLIGIGMGEVTRNTTGSISLYLAVYLGLPVVGAVLSGMGKKIGNALIEYSPLSKIEVIATAHSTNLTLDILVILAWAVLIYALGAARFKRYFPQ